MECSPEQSKADTGENNKPGALFPQGKRYCSAARPAVHLIEAVALDPQNMEYQMLLQRLQSGGQWYESRQAAYGYPHVGGNDLCLKICLANLFCNLCCGGGGLCFGGYGGRGMF